MTPTREELTAAAEPATSLTMSSEGASVELILDTSRVTNAEWIPGEGGDICLYRDSETGKVMGAFLPLYQKRLIVNNDFASRPAPDVNQKLLEAVEKAHELCGQAVDVKGYRQQLAELISVARARQKIDVLIDEPIRMTMGQAADELTRLRAENERLKGNKRGMVCPFCGEDDFDAAGLQAHIANKDCDECASITPTRQRVF